MTTSFELNIDYPDACMDRRCATYARARQPARIFDALLHTQTETMLMTRWLFMPILFVIVLMVLLWLSS